MGEIVALATPDMAVKAPLAAQASGFCHDLIERVRSQFDHLDRQVPDIVAIATRLGMSERTLRRRLSELQTSYRAILSDVRAERARHRLQQSSATVDEIAEELGYTEAANFRHAFWRWTGCSPREFRRQCAEASRALRAA